MASLFEAINSLAAPVPFVGAGFDSSDTARLTRQIDCIRAVAIDGEWRTIPKLTGELRKRFKGVGFPENSVQAQLRNLRKIGYQVERRSLGRGLFEYRLLPAINPGIGAAMRKGDCNA